MKVKDTAPKEPMKKLKNCPKSSRPTWGNFASKLRAYRCTKCGTIHD